MARVWLVRLGKFGEQEAHALATGELATGWVIPNFPTDSAKDHISRALAETYPNEKSGTLQNWAVQLNQLMNVVREGDLTVTPLKTTGQVAIGRVKGPARVNGDGRPCRVVTWLKTDLVRDAIKQDLLYSLGASQTVCEVARNQAGARFEAIVSSGRDPGYANEASKPQGNVASDEGDAEVDFSITARDQIERHIASTFAGHAFTELIAAILRAQGYQTRVSPPGADKGVDIVAGQGALGFNGPKLVVQVKSGDVVVDQPTLQGLLGSIQDVHADQGLLVSWSGFRSAVTQRTNELFFRVRLWGRAEIMDALFSVYERLPEDIRAELPLRRTWSLVTEE
jgi:restriction system protein